MIFISYQELLRDLEMWALPRFDVYVGVPRSGIIPATYLALKHNAKVSTPLLWGGKEVLDGGLRDQLRSRGSVLTLDDSLLSGRSLKEARRQVDGKFAAVYVKPGMEKHVDYFCKLVPMPRIFEWNWMHHYWLQHACVDIDGVLCEDPEPWHNDDGIKYRKFLKTVRPKWIPTVQIDTLVTSRLEKYRLLTEAWLAKHHVSYRKLIMHPAASKKERQQANDHGKRKAREYRNPRYRLFVESSERQAREINKLTGKPVLCTDRMEMYV